MAIIKTNMFNNSQRIIEFFQVYPAIIQKIDKENLNKFKDCFKKPEILLDENDDIELKKKRYSFIKTKTLLNLNHKKSRRKTIIKRKVSIFKEDNQIKELIFAKSFTNTLPFKNNGIETEGDYYLINKGINLQNHKKKRTEDVRIGIELFLFNSKFFESLCNNFYEINTKINPKKFLKNREEFEDNEKNQNKIETKINNIVFKLSEKVIIKKYQKNTFVIKMNEIGKDCYFLVSGKLSILKPVEYNNLKISFMDYLIYLKCLLNNDEIELILKVLSANSTFLEIRNIDEINKLIRAYFIKKFQKYLNNFMGGISMEEIEFFFKRFHFTFEDFQLDKNKILKDIEKKEEKNKNVNMFLLNYFSSNIRFTNEEAFILELHRISHIEKDKVLVTLYKYEIFLFLYPGSFFGDMALESAIKKRNATIRTEEDCIICSLSNEYYASLLSEENKKLKTSEICFLCNNFFFNLISKTIFIRYYYPMFKAVEKVKDEVIYKQNEKISSIFLVKEGIVKMELYANVIDLFELIKNICKEIYLKNNCFKAALNEILNMKNNYLYDKQMSQIYNNDKILFEANKKINFELFSSNGYECLGIQEFCLKKKYMTTCTIVSKKALLMEIKKEDLSRMIKNEREILPSYYKYVFKKLLLLIKRLYYLKTNLINQLKNKFDFKSLNYFNDSNISKYYRNSSININIQGNNNHIQKIRLLNSEKVKKICSEKNNNGNIKNNNLLYTERNTLHMKNNNLSSKNLIHSKIDNNSNRKKLLNSSKYNLNNESKNISSLNVKAIQKEFSNINDEYIKTNLSFSKMNTNKNRYRILSKNNFDNNKIINDFVNTKQGYISINKIKRNIKKRTKENKQLIKLNIVKNIDYTNINKEEKSLELDYFFPNIKLKKTIFNNFKFNNLIKPKNKSSEIKRNDDNLGKSNQLFSKYENENNSILNGNGFYIENSSNRLNYSALNINSKESFISNNYINNKKENEGSYNKKGIFNSSMSSFRGIQTKNKKIRNLIRNMKRNYQISMGQKKFIFYRKSKKNKAIINDDDNKFRQTTIGQSIKEYYYKKIVEGYSALINPLNNTYINRQKTIKVTNNNKYK